MNVPDVELDDLNLPRWFDDMIRRSFPVEHGFSAQQLLEMRRMYVAGVYTAVLRVQEDGFDLQDLQHECEMFHQLMKDGKA